MKMTLHIDENLLAEVMESHEFETKTEAIDFALRDLDRRKKLRTFMKKGLGLTPEELKSAYDPDYHPDRCMVADEPVIDTSDKKKS